MQATTALGPSSIFAGPTPLQLAAQKLVVLLSYFILLLGISTVVVTAALVFISYSPMPYWDQWMLIDRIAQSNGHVSFSLLWAQHNEHRIFFPKLFYVTDLYVAGGRNIFLLVSIFLAQMLHCCLWGWIFRTYAGFSGAAWRTAFGIAAFCLFAPNQYENFIWGFQISFLLPCLAATGSLVALLQHDKSRRSGGKMASADYLLLALCAAVLGSYSMANGVLTWPLLLFAAIVLRLPVRTILLISAAAGVTLVLFFSGHITQAHAASFSRLWSLESAKFALDCFSSGLKQITSALADVFAVSAILVIAVLCVRMLWKREANDLFLVLSVGVGLFCCGTAAMIAMGRVEQGLASRYETITMLFWLCAALLVLRWLWRPDSENKVDSLAIVAFQASVFLIMVLVNPTVGDLRQNLVERRQGMETAALAAIVRVPDPSLIGVVPDGMLLSGDLDSDLPFLRKLHTWLYSDKFYLSYGDRLDHAYTMVSKQQCGGALELVKPIAESIQRGARVSGWAWDTARNRPASKIVIVTPDGVVSGLAQGGGYGLQRDTSIAHPPQAIWRGFLRALPQPLPVRAYAVVADESSACPLEVGVSVPAEFAGANAASAPALAATGHL